MNCTGPRDSLNDAPATLFQNLFDRGLVRPDELDMGIEVTPDFAAVSTQGCASEFLFAIGSLLKGTLWETTAVPELRAQALQVAKALLADDQRPNLDWRKKHLRTSLNTTSSGQNEPSTPLWCELYIVKTCLNETRRPRGLASRVRTRSPGGTYRHVRPGQTPGRDLG